MKIAKRAEENPGTAQTLTLWAGTHSQVGWHYPKDEKRFFQSLLVPRQRHNGLI